MGFQDRDYYRESGQSGYVTSVVIKLIIINIVVWFAEAVLFSNAQDANGRNLLASLLGVHADTIVRPLYWWQFVTAGFVQDWVNPQHLLFNMIGLYCFGMPLEQRYGRREFLRFYFCAIVLGTIVSSATHYLQIIQRFPPEQVADVAQKYLCFGASGGVTAVTLLFCLLYPRATLLAAFLFPVPAWIVGVFIILSNLLGNSGSSLMAGGVAYDVHLVGAALAVAYWYFGWNFGRLPGLDKLKRLVGNPQKWIRPRPPLKVHDPEHYYEDLDAQAEELLEKVNIEGLSALTDKERRVLEDYSRRMRQKLR
jgi:membrane associated rhomboid family serine protease